MPRDFAQGEMSTKGTRRAVSCSSEPLPRLWKQSKSQDLFKSRERDRNDGFVLFFSVKESKDGVVIQFSCCLFV